MAYGYWYNQSGLGECPGTFSPPVFEEHPAVPTPQPQAPQCCACEEEAPFPWWAVVLAFLVGYTIHEDRRK